MSRIPARAIPLLGAVLLAVGCSDPVAQPVLPTDASPDAAKLGAPGAAADRQLYQVRLGDANGSRSHGVMLIEVVGGHLAVTVHAAGLPPSVNVPQHIHLNPTCSPGGGILLNLDAALTVGGEAPGVGAAYPMSNHAGVVKYHASRPLTELRAAVNARFGTTLGSDAELLAWLNLEERNGHMHVHTSPFTPMNCGEVERLN